MQNFIFGLLLPNHYCFSPSVSLEMVAQSSYAVRFRAGYDLRLKILPPQRQLYLIRVASQFHLPDNEL
jgi:hypothetical protein